MSQYPAINLSVLRGLIDLKQLVAEDEGFLTAPACPYGNDTVTALQALFEKTVIVERIAGATAPAEKRGRRRPTKDKALSDDDAVEVEQEVKELLAELKLMGGPESRLDAAAKLGIIKTKGMLIEKALQMRERATTQKRMSGFMSTVLGICDDLMTEDQRALFMERLEPYRN